jgi:hypothetical protein
MGVPDASAFCIGGTQGFPAVRWSMQNPCILLMALIAITVG